MDIYRKKSNGLIMGAALFWVIVAGIVLGPSSIKRVEENQATATQAALAQAAAASSTADALAASAAETAAAEEAVAASTVAAQQTAEAAEAATEMAIAEMTISAQETISAEATSTAAVEATGTAAVEQAAATATAAVAATETALLLTRNAPPPPPCLVTLAQQYASSQAIYPQPSRGRLKGAQTIETAEVKLYTKLENEPWWHASDVNSSEASGWVHIDQLEALPEECGRLLIKKRSEIADFSNYSPILDATFSSPNDVWSGTGPGQVRIEWRDDLAFLQLADNSEDLDASSTAAEAQNLPSIGDFILHASFQRIPASFEDSYVGVRISSRESPDTFVEIRSNRRDCGISYHIGEAGIDPQPPILIPLGSDAGCLEGDPTFIELSLSHDTDTKNALIDFQYNDLELNTLEILDEQNLFSRVELQLLANKTTALFDYVFVAGLPGE